MHPTPLIGITATTALHAGLERVRTNAAYARAVAAGGGVPVILPPAESGGLAVEITDRLDGLLLAGGEDVDPVRYGEPPHPRTQPPNPYRDAAELALVAAARARRLPILAVCRGLQLLNVAHGGSLVQDIGDELPGALEHQRDRQQRGERVHAVKVEAESRLAAALGARRLHVNSVHHQAARRIGEGLRIVARAEDGLVEGLEWSGDGWWAVSVQWHPEELIGTAEPWDRSLFSMFVREAAAHGRSAV